ncbi:TetR/AcrR family transcriptional regulator C-terminal domain-containing protein [Streptomyces sp. ISID311]|uniref:TetR/AcrR family transcriptional regulator C-terminal domain-containing protein n=1 Tax=Streptomyces sp. ISID311 TaxID=2601673 RepID=UPI0021C31B39|nr:TetR/AcrR family transcriptional regulator C-terminal domain-containing protein [Streptomyces sp. ISID311]
MAHAPALPGATASAPRTVAPFRRHDEISCAKSEALIPSRLLRQFSEILLTFIEDADQVAFTRLVIAESRRSPWVAEEFYRVGKEPLTKTLAGCLQRLHETGGIDCPSPELAAHQFLGLVQEFIIWPKVMAIGPDVMSIPPFDVVVEEGIAMFLSRYGVSDEARAALPV